MFTLVPNTLTPLSGFILSIRMLKKVVLPLPFSPIKAIFSPLFKSKERLENKCLSPKLLLKFSACKTSYPLLTEVSNLIFAGPFSSSGASIFSILSRAFSLLSAALILFSLLKDLNFSIIASCLFISAC